MTKIYGIRHHGPGCARSLVKALESSKPDLILLEAPLEAEELLAQGELDELVPPVAMLFYSTENREHSSFYPFARFSPEWQAIQWANGADVPIRCFDLPISHKLSSKEQESEDEETSPLDNIYREDPFNWFAKADGYSDGERWWNDKIEERGDCDAFFEAILHAVTTLRSELQLKESNETLRREAWMRLCMRQAEKDGYENIAIICGAWHAPALVDLPTLKSDKEIVKGLSKIKISSTWAPWTYQRLTYASGYGAGIRAPGWYDHLWNSPNEATARWLTRAARILRQQDLEGSSASIIEATRLADSLAGLRGRPRAGLDETLEAIASVFAAGDTSCLSILHRPLLVGDQLGVVPKGLVRLPLQLDIEEQQRKLRMKPEAGVRELVIDLRKDSSLAKSVFLHRLLILDINWGKKTTARSKGTFKETWILQWEPELSLSIIDASRFGGTLEIAASNKLQSADEAESLQDLIGKLDLALFAQLPGSTQNLLKRIDDSATNTPNLSELLESVPKLAKMARYGDVRDTDQSAIIYILMRLVVRVHIELPGLGVQIDEESARRLSTLIHAYSEAIATFQSEELHKDLQDTFRRMLDKSSVHPRLRGLALRLMRDAGSCEETEVELQLCRALSRGNSAAESAAWLEGFLSGSGSLLIHDRSLLGSIHKWLLDLSDNTFQETLPILRRTFGSFTPSERTQIASRIGRGADSTNATQFTKLTDFDITRSIPVLRTVAKLLNLPSPGHE